MGNAIFAPAKLTKGLKVVGVRSDGFHEIETEMVSLAFGDILDISEGHGQVSIIDDLDWFKVLPEGLQSVPVDGSNLINDALELLGRSANVKLRKRVPPGTGLGGGSSDAAAILRYFGANLPSGVVAKLGADVPFCVNGGRAIASGIGEELQPLDYLDETYLLLISPFSVPTRDVYRMYDIVGSVDNAINELETAATECEPRLVTSKAVLAELSGKPAILAGSGSTYFVSSSLDRCNILGTIKDIDNFRYIDFRVEGTNYRLIEASTVPAHS